MKLFITYKLINEPWSIFLFVLLYIVYIYTGYKKYIKNKTHFSKLYFWKFLKPLKFLIDICFY